MSDQASKIILLCEDESQERLTREYLKKCGAKNVERILRAEVAGGFTRVLDQFPRELRACRSRHAKTLLVVLIDADQLSVEQRHSQLNERAKAAELAEVASDEPVVIFIPKRNIETWLEALLGNQVNEEDVCKKRKKLTKDNFRQAARTLFDWSRPNAKPGPTIVDSLKKSLPGWKKVSDSL